MDGKLWQNEKMIPGIDRHASVDCHGFWWGLKEEYYKMWDSKCWKIDDWIRCAGKYLGQGHYLSIYCNKDKDKDGNMIYKWLYQESGQPEHELKEFPLNGFDKDEEIDLTFANSQKISEMFDKVSKLRK